ncbi:MAG: DUF3048 domain-containing protein [Bacillota bacterium]
MRSSRPYFALLAKEWGAVFGHCGGDPELDRYINEWKVVDANEFGLGHLFLERQLTAHASQLVHLCREPQKSPYRGTSGSFQEV